MTRTSPAYSLWPLPKPCRSASLSCCIPLLVLGQCVAVRLKGNSDTSFLYMKHTPATALRLPPGVQAGQACAVDNITCSFSSQLLLLHCRLVPPSRCSCPRIARRWRRASLLSAPTQSRTAAPPPSRWWSGSGSLSLHLSHLSPPREEY